ncbi:ASKHA domain-containing protein [Desulfovibrio litoralis]|uniref:Uncharacterized 2Fe-2 and 4Fe-4S clusters-containing protein, contains DUF4445 domain n=1 Tax=Desulfovibrio litoralis DSM 11393 TaxID=1121455 RepID=A0A1M7S9H4_9BACT|nr:ASKHA domain-containing protein [Desulfovibrio litoralis]SHN55090.1 Uncharacterized 2Fe-2 and 4Fe-4S clusters-containing protein, contains DUF4445 domain [Desulfovibrio litoralis DSM 11393]
MTDLKLVLIPKNKENIQNIKLDRQLLETEECNILQIKADKEEFLSQVIYLSGLLEPLPLCSGLGSCTLCRIRFLENPPKPLNQELNKLSAEDIKAGWRLSCLRKIEDEPLYLALPKYARLARTTHKVAKNQLVEDQNVTLAIDLGSTSVYWSVNSQDNNANLQNIKQQSQQQKVEGVFLNPQMGAGADVISRLAFANTLEKRRQLQNVTLDSFRRILNDLTDEGFPRPKELCLAANSVMTYLTLNKDPQRLAAAPYNLTYRGGCYEYLEGLPPIWVAPLLSPFVGGDISAGIAFILFGKEYVDKKENFFDEALVKPEYPFILADLGTNGEFVLCLGPDDAIISSVPMGPALEGIGLSCGAMASPGIISSFSLSPQGLLAHKLQQTEMHSTSYAVKKEGLTATAYLNLLAHLLQLNIIDANGLFKKNNEIFHPLAKKVLLQNGEERLINDQVKGTYLKLDDKLYLSSVDIEEILKVKAAFSLAVKSLLNSGGIQFKDLKHFFLAGALGKYIAVENLETLGFLPLGGGNLVKNIGNSSLSGAKLFLKYPETRERILTWITNIKELELARQQAFIDAYVEDMKFSFY